MYLKKAPKRAFWLIVCAFFTDDGYTATAHCAARGLREKQMLGHRVGNQEMPLRDLYLVAEA